MGKRIKGFEAHRRGKKRSKASDGTVQQAYDTGQEAFRDWRTNAVRGQSARREADVVPID